MRHDNAFDNASRSSQAETPPDSEQAMASRSSQASDIWFNSSSATASDSEHATTEGGVTWPPDSGVETTLQMFAEDFRQTAVGRGNHERANFGAW